MVVGAGVVGCAVARALAVSGREVLLVERHGAPGHETSSRNSEVIHAGIYYPPGSLKARLCVEGKRLLYEFCEENGVPHQRIGKLLVATNQREADSLEGIRRRAEQNGVCDLRPMSAGEVAEMEPELRCVAALHSPSTGIVDSHSFMMSLMAGMEAAGGTFAPYNRIVRAETGRGTNQGFDLLLEDVNSGERASIRTRYLVNSAGLQAQQVAAAIDGVPPAAVPRRFLARGCYFAANARLPFSRLIYPVPVDGGLGVHLTLDLGGGARFGPDVEWVESIDYKVDPRRADAFYAAIRTYYPALPDDCLVPDYAGIRPKVTGPGEPAGDFVVSGPNQHGVPGLVNLFGIESPGLTACLALAEVVKQTLREAD